VAVIDGAPRGERTGAHASATGPTVFLDKDGTVIEDLPYNVDPSRIRLAPNARAGLRLLADAGARLVVVTNQSGVARGYFTASDLAAVADHLAAEIGRLGGRLEGFYFCPHLPDGINEYAIECTCRKPLPGLVQRAARELGLETDGAWFIGDTWMDVVAGRAAGCRTIMVGPEHRDAPSLPPERRPDHAVPDLLAAARIIIGPPAGAAA
jgi:D-glycero-D-manno-heptose 1,7-bisphosphate phosphatase